MPPVVSLIVLALAVSLDGFGVGAMYGLRKIRIPLLSICIISLLSGGVIFAAMQIGKFLSGLFSPHIASYTGSAILVGIGIWTLCQTAFQNRRKRAEQAISLESIAKAVADVPINKTVFRIKFRQFSLVVQILQSPSVADVDQSGIISSSEAALLGVALSLDAFGAGIGAAMIGLKPLLTAGAIAVFGGAFIAIGLETGNWLSDRKWMRGLTFLPGLILIAMGMMKLLNS